MNKIRWFILNLSCLLLGFILSSLASQVWAHTQHPVVSAPAQLPAVRAAVNLLLVDDDYYYLYFPYVLVEVGL